MENVKRLLMSVVAVVAAVIFVFANPKAAMAEEATITYYFANEQVPEGEQPVLVVNEEMMRIFRENPALIDVFATALADKYDTGSKRIDARSEAAYILGVLTGTVPGGIHIPTYENGYGTQAIATAEALSAKAEMTSTITTSPEMAAANAAALGMAGRTFIDINKTTQRLYYYVNGELVYESPVVTGNVKAGHTTPSGTFSVYGKARNRTLRGKGYASFVKYWMPIVKNIGIHDASWRSDFGGEIYKTSGSHGCINIPPANMPALYEAVSVGTPVIVHE